MGRTITNYLTEGHPSRIYLLTFIQPMSGYKLAKKIYGQPTTAKIYGWAKKMMAKGYLEKHTDGYHATIKPLIEELTIMLKEKGETLDFHEKKLLARILDNDAFRKAISNTYESWNKRTHNIIDLTLDFLPVMCSLTLNIKIMFDDEDITVTQALRVLSAKNELHAMPVESPIDIPFCDQIMYSHLEKMGMHRKSGINESDDDLSEYLQYSFFAKLPKRFLMKISKLGSNSQYLTYIFAMIAALDRAFLKAQVEEFQRQQQSKTDH